MLWWRASLYQNLLDPKILLMALELLYFLIGFWNTLSVLFILFCWKYKVPSSLYGVFSDLVPCSQLDNVLIGGRYLVIYLFISHMEVFFLKKIFATPWHTGSLLYNQGSDLCSPQQKHGVLTLGLGSSTKCLWLCRDKVNVWWWWDCPSVAGHYSGFVRALPALLKNESYFQISILVLFSQYFPFPKIDLAFSIQLDR